MRRWMGFVLLALSAGSSSGQELADLILEDGRIYTFERDDGLPVVDAVAIRDGQIIAAGTSADVDILEGVHTRRIDLDGATALPGLVDAHAHLFHLGRALSSADLTGTRSADEAIDRARKLARSLPPDAWLRGRGWDQNDWEERVYPNRAPLDAAFGERPVYFERIDGHAAWVNTAALEAAGITRDTADPEGGEILRHPETGEPSGILIDAAESFVLAVIPKPSPADLDRQLAAAAQKAVSLGLTGVHEMGVSPEELEALRRAEAAGTLPLRVVAYLGGAPALAAFEGGPVRPGPNRLLRVEGVKYYVDGALGSRGAALLDDYSDRPGHRGLLMQSQDALAAQIANAATRGFSVAVHAIGDRGNRVALSAIETGHARAVSSREDLPALRAARHRIEHVQVVHPEDFDRFARLGVIPSMQPTHCTSDMPWAPERVGPDRILGAYAWRQFLDRDLILPLGSDFPVEEVSPLYGLYAAVTRQTADGQPPGGWAPDQRLSREEAILGFTAWAAEAAGVPQWGRLRVGDRADLTVWSDNPLTVPADELLDLEVRQVVVEGVIRFPGNSPDTAAGP